MLFGPGTIDDDGGVGPELGEDVKDTCSLSVLKVERCMGWANTPE